jgi:hypothetical protein
MTLIEKWRSFTTENFILGPYTNVNEAFDDAIDEFQREFSLKDSTMNRLLDDIDFRDIFYTFWEEEKEA